MHRRGGVSMLEVLFGLGVLCFLAILCAPMLLTIRESARKHTCQSRLKTLSLGLQSYHDVHGWFPPAAIWNVNATQSLALHRSKRIERITQMNWVQMLLPHIGESQLGKQTHPEASIGNFINKKLRTTSLAAMTCPSDDFNRSSNPYRLTGHHQSPVEFARGNYAINGGSHNFEIAPPTTRSPQGDFVHLVMKENPRQYSQWGNGIAGINKAFRLQDLTNGTATMVALEEVRAGVHPLDPRGVWALGQIGGSLTWGHGVNGDDFGPNNQWDRADDILGCGALHSAIGQEALAKLQMPCVDYVDANQQATARSRHSGGVSVSFVDGSVRFISNDVDPGVWHVIHSRETPADWLHERLDESLTQSEFQFDAVSTSTPDHLVFEPVTNSIQQSFVVLPAESFMMGIPDVGNDADPPVECPQHEVRLTHPRLMSVDEVTRGQFATVMGEAHLPSVPSIAEVSKLNENLIDRLPVTGISWNQATEFCRRLSLRPAEQRARRAYRLPTEAEWESAARAGDRTAYRWSLMRVDGDESGDAAGIFPPLPLTPVGSYPPNAWGLHDMRGNAWEWTADWFDRDYYARSPVENPQGPEGGDIKVVRGSSWRFVGEICRIDYAVLPPWKTNPAIGFRILCEVHKKPRHVTTSD